MSEMKSKITVYLTGFFCLMLTCESSNETDRWKKIGDMQLTNKYLEVNCYGEAFENVTFPKVNLLAGSLVRTVNFYNCLPSNVTYATALGQINIFLPVTLPSLILTFDRILTTQPFNATHFEGLQVIELTINNEINSPLLRDWSVDIIKPLKKLRQLSLSNTDLPLFTDRLQVLYVTVWYGASFGAWGDCSELRGLKLYHWNLKHISNDWLSNCSKLKSLELMNMQNFTTDQLRRAVEGVSSLENLVISHCGLDTFPVDLNFYTKNLRDLSVNTNRFRQLQLADLTMESLSRLNLRNSNISEIKGIPKTKAQKFYLMLDGERITSWRFGKHDYDNLKNLSMTVEANELILNCDCQHAWFTRAIKDKLLNLVGSRHRGIGRTIHQCTDGTNFTRVASHSTNCKRFDCDGCTCRRQWSDNTTVARCPGAATRVPRVWGLRALHAAGNRVETVSADDLPDSLLFLDLSDNQLSSIDVNTTLALFSIEERRIRLSGNPITCHCGNKLLIETLQKHKKQVEDYKKLWCWVGEEKRTVRSIVTSELCAAQHQLYRNMLLTISLAILVALLGLVAAAGVLYCRYKHSIKACLYSRGYCMWWLRNEELDHNRPYDAFISFSHSETQFVMDKILPTLDNEYKICLYYRDRVVGERIPDLITRHAQQSRRIIIVLSRQFLESMSGQLELRTVQESALREGDARIIVIVLDNDVFGDKSLSPELLRYIRDKNYIRWGEKLFWEKLRYAMPHQRITGYAVTGTV